MSFLTLLGIITLVALVTFGLLLVIYQGETDKALFVWCCTMAIGLIYGALSAAFVHIMNASF